MFKSSMFVAATMLATTVGAEKKQLNKAVNLPGEIAGGAIICDNPLQAGYDLRLGCIHADDDHETAVHVLHIDGEIATVRVAGKVYYTMSNWVVVTYKGARIGLVSYAMGKLPPGIK